MGREAAMGGAGSDELGFDGASGEECAPRAVGTTGVSDEGSCATACAPSLVPDALDADEVRAGVGDGAFAEAGEDAGADGVAEVDEYALPAAEAEAEAEARARALAEHNALARVFDDVRAQSANSRLVTPARWAEIGLVPAHLTPDEFEMLVYEYLEDDRAARAEAAAAAAELEPAPVFRTATRAVGIPAFLRSADGESEGVEEEAGEPARASQDEEMCEAGDGEPVGRGDAGAIGGGTEGDAAGAKSSGDPDGASSPDGSGGAGSPDDLGRSGSLDGAVGSGGFGGSGSVGDSDDPFAGLNIPAGYRLEEIEGEYVLVETGEGEDDVELDIDCEHIATLVGAHSYYVYDRTIMTDTYAHWAFLAAEDDRVVTFVECVREDSRVYPRPLAASSLKNPPFRMTDEDIAATWEAVQASGEHPDIERTVASNGDVYFFSPNHLSPAYAASLAEWDAVERRLHM